MTMYFSPSKVAFYDGDLETAYKSAGSWPSDAASITDATYQTFIAQPPEGKVLGASGSAPAWVDVPAPTLAQQAAAAIGAGLTITSTSTSALDGIYAVDEAAQGRVNRIAVYLQINGTFPGGASTITWLDTSGGKHVFDAAQFKMLATAIGDYVAALDDVILGLSTTLPSASATIA